GAVRAVCEPYFDRPLAEISLGQVLLRLFQTSRRFNVEIQPQLVLLQKTLLNVEGMGRDLDPELDLWKTAKPYLERWMHKRIGIHGLRERVNQEASQWAQIQPQIPRLVYTNLNQENQQLSIKNQLELLRKAQQQNNNILMVIAAILAVLIGLVIWFFMK